MPTYRIITEYRYRDGLKRLNVPYFICSVFRGDCLLGCGRGYFRYDSISRALEEARFNRAMGYYND